MSRRRLTHEADGLYYLNEARLLAGHACYSHRNLWVRTHGRWDVPVTLKRMVEHLQGDHNGTSACWWLASRMYINDLITRKEYLTTGGLNSPSPHTQATALMDLLAVRARREGRLK